MPQELFPPRPTADFFLTASPERTNAQLADSAADEQHVLTDNVFRIEKDESDDRELQLSNSLRRKEERFGLHPYVQVLSLADLEACVALENAAFPENERCSREKFIYRLRTCPELSLGLFSTTNHPPDPLTQPAYDAARPPDSTNPSHRTILLAHVFATLTAAPVVTDPSIAIPPDHQPPSPQPLSRPSNTDPSSTSTSSPPPPTNQPAVHTPARPLTTNISTTTHHDPPSLFKLKPTPKPTSSPAPLAGHDPTGRTIAIHSVCVLPTHQDLGLGRTVLKAYMQRMESSGIADRMAVLAHPELVGWYVDKFGFEEKGESEVMFGGRGWRELVYDIVDKGLEL